MSTILEFQTAKKAIRWWWRQRARRLGRAQDVESVSVHLSPEEAEKSSRTYAEMVKCLARRDEKDDDDLHPLLARAAVLSSLDVKGNDQQNEADSTFAPDIIEWSATYAGRGLGIIERRMRKRRLLRDPQEGGG